MSAHCEYSPCKVVVGVAGDKLINGRDSNLEYRRALLAQRILEAQEVHVRRQMSVPLWPEKVSLFRLVGEVESIDDRALFERLDAGAKEIHDAFYHPSQLKSRYAPWRHRIQGVTFTRVSFTRTIISDFEFNGCTFDRCEFIGSTFRNCRFTSCKFLVCNPYRIEFSECFIDPRQFDECVPLRGYENVGLHLFHELLRNSRQQAQPDFADEAQFRFRKWQRYQITAEMSHTRSWWNRAQKGIRAIAMLMFDMTTGSGMRVSRLLITAALLLMFMGSLNWRYAAALGLHQDGQVIASYWDAFYVSAVITTTLGFGDITPSTTLGRIVVSGEAILGFVLFAMLTSTLYRRISS